MRELASLTCLIIALYDKPSVPSCLGEEHAEIVDAIAKGQKERAVDLMLHHLKHVEENLDLTIVEAAPVDLDAVLTEQ
jgi:DNA-binding GntR family transcriptional regulator